MPNYVRYLTSCKTPSGPLLSKIVLEISLYTQSFMSVFTLLKRPWARYCVPTSSRDVALSEVKVEMFCEYEQYTKIRIQLAPSVTSAHYSVIGSQNSQLKPGKSKHYFQCKQNIDFLSPNEVVVANQLRSSYIFTHAPDRVPLAFIWLVSLVSWQMQVSLSLSFKLCFGLHQL